MYSIIFIFSLVVFTMGPIRSRPFTMALHSVIGIGFLAGTFLVKPFLPQEGSVGYELSFINNINCNLWVFSFPFISYSFSLTLLSPIYSYKVYPQMKYVLMKEMLPKKLTTLGT